MAADLDLDVVCLDAASDHHSPPVACPPDWTKHSVTTNDGKGNVQKTKYMLQMLHWLPLAKRIFFKTILKEFPRTSCWNVPPVSALPQHTTGEQFVFLSQVNWIRNRLFCYLWRNAGAVNLHFNSSPVLPSHVLEYLPETVCHYIYILLHVTVRSKHFKLS